MATKTTPARNLKLVKRLFTVRSEWAYPDNLGNQNKYHEAIAWLRRGTTSKWIMDEGTPKPAWTLATKAL